MKTCKTHCKWCGNYWYAAVGFLLVIIATAFSVGTKAKIDVTTGCNYSIGIGGSSSVAAGTPATFDISAWPTNCTTEGDTAISITQDTAPTITGSAVMPTCTVDVGSLHLPTSGVAKAKINCVTTPNTANGYYKYYANFSPVNGVTPLSTWFTFSVTASTSIPAAPSGVTATYSTVPNGPEIQIKLTDNASNESEYRLSWHLSGTAWLTTFQPTGTSTWSFPANSGAIQIAAPTTSGTYEYKLEACNASGCSGSTAVSVVVPGTASSTAGPTLMGTIFKDGQYIDPATSTARNCVSPNYWMKEGSTGSGARGWHCMPIMGSNAATSNDYPPTPCTGTLWAGNSSGTGTSTSTDYCAVTSTTTTTTTCPSSQYWSGTACVNNTTTTGTACENGKKCSANSWCQSGQSFYYPTGELTCAAWSNDGTQPQAPAGTSACKPSDTNCVDIGQTVAFVSGKWCTRGMSYYSKDQMTCVANGGPAPAGFGSCKPGDTQCIPTGGYGSSTGYCSNGMTFYQKIKDTDPNNDRYCAEMKYQTGTATMTTPMQPPEPPAGYGACEPTNTGCKEKGDKWTDSNSTYWCSNGQKCNLSGGGGSCVGWSESCPSGSKYCSATDTYCVEPGETKEINTSSTTGYSSYWCGGGGGMVFYSGNKAYCEAKKSDNTTTMMWTSSEVKAILSRLGTGWGLCPPKGSTGTSSYNSSRCIEPGQTGSSSDWCAWWPPMSGGMSGNTPGSTRACPGFDDTTDPVKPPVKEICPSMPTVISCPAGQTMVKVEGKGTCGGYNYCKSDNVKEPICPAVMPVKCAEGQTYQKGVSPNGCTYTYCSDDKMQPPIPQPPIYPQFDQCRMAKEQSRGYKYELKQIEASGKFLPKGMALPDDLITLIKAARAAYDAIDKLFPLGTKVICTDELGKSVQEQVTALSSLMDTLRTKAANSQSYMRCIQFQNELDERIKMLEENVKSMRKSGTFSITEEFSAMKELRAKTPAICKEADQYTVQDLYDERQDIEDALNDKFNNNANTARDTFVTDTIYDIRNGIADARQQIKAKNLGAKDQCQKIETLFTQVEALMSDAKVTYDAGDQEAAGQVLDKIFRFEEPVKLSAEQCGIDLEIGDGKVNTSVYSNVGNLSNEEMDALVTRIVDKATERFAAILDEKIKQLTARLAQVKVSTKTEEQIQTSMTALQDVPKDARTDTEAAKNATIDTLVSFDKAKSQIKADLYARVRAALERATSLNLFGESAGAVKSQAEALKLHAENGDVTGEDVAAFEQALSGAEKQNTDECYRVGGCRFRDIDPSTWYYSYLQNSTSFKGESDSAGNRTGNVGPGRSTLRAEALIAIERTAGIKGVDGECALTAGVATGVKGVPAWANCAVNEAVAQGIRFNGPLNESVTRDEVASWMVAFEKDSLPVEGSGKFTGDFRDMNSCRDSAAVSYIVANKIMTGYGGDRAGTWGCGQPLLRAELAAVLSRLEELLSLSRAAVID